MDRTELHGINRVSKKDPAYVAAVVRQLPQKNDLKDQRIVKIIRDELIVTPWARDAFSAIKGQQVDYLRDMLANLNEPYVHEATQAELGWVAGRLNSQVVEGQEIIDRLPPGEPVLIATNHIGTFKEGAIDPRGELGVNIENFDLMFPYPLYAAPLYPVAQVLEDNLYYTGFEFPLEFGEIYEAAGFIPIRPPLPETEGNRTKELEDLVKDSIVKRPNSAIIHFPEGGTSGKRNERGPYDLGEYKTGIFVVAAHLGVPILPVAQYFNPEKGFELGVFEPIRLGTRTTREEFEAMAREVQNQHQSWLNQKKHTPRETRMIFEREKTWNLIPENAVA